MNAERTVTLFRPAAASLTSLVFLCGCALAGNANQGIAATQVFGPQAYATSVSLPPLETDARLVNAKYENGQIEIRDSADNSPIVMPRGIPITGPFTTGRITPTVEFQSQPTGCDIRYTFTNTTSAPMPLKAVGVGIITIGQNISWLSQSRIPTPVQANADAFIGQAFMYPADFYSPSMVLQGDKYTVSLSMQYPILSYQHDVRVGVASPGNIYLGGEGGRGWYVDFRLSNCGDETSYARLANEAIINPGETRTYVMSLRVSRTDRLTAEERKNDYLRTLKPYRDFFQATYGAVKYERNPNPVLGLAIADVGLITSNNPSGFCSAYRADLNGYGKLVRDLNNKYSNWPRMMIWAPTGVYDRARQYNWPSIIASRFRTTNEFLTAFDPTLGFRAVSGGGRQLGLWWGNTALVAENWEPDTMELFDPDNAHHVELQLKELDAAVQSGATELGLDTFSCAYTPIWKLAPWLNYMQKRHPGVRFITEPDACDILHNMAPTFTAAWVEDKRPATMDDILGLKSPHYLADFLNPGQESWAGFRYVAHKRFFNYEPTEQDVVNDMQRIADLGFVPCMSWSVNPVNMVQAADTRYTSLPVDMRPAQNNGGTGGGGGGGGGSGGGDNGGGGGSGSGSGSGGGDGSGGSGGSGSGGGGGGGGGDGIVAPKPPVVAGGSKALKASGTPVGPKVSVRPARVNLSARELQALRIERRRSTLVNRISSPYGTVKSLPPRVLSPSSAPSGPQLANAPQVKGWAPVPAKPDPNFVGPVGPGGVVPAEKKSEFANVPPNN